MADELTASGHDGLLLRSQASTADESSPSDLRGALLPSLAGSRHTVHRLRRRSVASVHEPTPNISAHTDDTDDSSSAAQRAFLGDASLDASKPFMCPLAYRCVVDAHAGMGVRFVPFERECTVAIIDISGYSGLATALKHRSAHVLASAINGYFEVVVSIVREFGGNVLTFAGDAMLVAWATLNPANGAAKALACALAVQTRVPTYDVHDATPTVTLRTHVGIASGTLRVEVFEPASHGRHFAVQSHAHAVQTCFAFFSGDALSGAGPACQHARAGQVAASETTIAYARACPLLQLENASPADGFVLVNSATLRSSSDTALQNPAAASAVAAAAAKGTDAVVDEWFAGSHEDDEDDDDETDMWSAGFTLAPPMAGSPPPHSCNSDGVAPRRPTRTASTASLGSVAAAGGRVELLEDRFMPPSVLAKLRVGLRAADVAELRGLVVLFIKHTGSAEVDQWFDEVFDVLCARQCPVVQVMDDDKGVHVVAAMNLFVCEDGAADAAVAVAAELSAHALGCAVGIAAGSCFCGVVGSVDAACRWDVTGWACVRACRLMEYAARTGAAVAIDASVLEQVTDKAAVKLQNAEAQLKGTDEPVPVFTTAAPSETRNIIGGICGVGDHFAEEVYSAEREAIQAFLFDLPADGVLNATSASCGSGKALLDTIRSVRSPTHRSGATQQQPQPLGRAVIVEGGANSGKKTLLLSAVTSTSRNSGAAVPVVPVMHRARSSAEPLALAGTLAAWFRRSPDDAVAAKAGKVADAYASRHLVRAQVLAAELLSLAARTKHLTHTATPAIVVDRAQHLDPMSVGLIRALCGGRGCLTTTGRRQRKGPSASLSLATPPPSMAASLEQQHVEPSVLFLLAFTPLQGLDDAATLQQQIPGSRLVRIRGTTPEGINAIHRQFAVYSFTPRTAAAMHEISSGMPGTFLAMLAHSVPAEIPAFFRWIEDPKAPPPHVCATANLVADFSQPLLRKLALARHRDVAPQFMDRLAAQYDVLSARQQTVLKVAAVLCRASRRGCACSVAAEIASGLLGGASRVPPQLLQQDIVTLSSVLFLELDDSSEHDTTKRATGEESGRGTPSPLSPATLAERRCCFATPSHLEYVWETLTPPQVAAVARKALKLFLAASPTRLRRRLCVQVPSCAAKVDECERHMTIARLSAFVGDRAEMLSAARAAWRAALESEAIDATCGPASGCAAAVRLLIAELGLAPEQLSVFNQAPTDDTWSDAVPSRNDAVPMPLEAAKNAEPPLVLGPLGGLATRLGAEFLIRYGLARFPDATDVRGLPRFDRAEYCRILDVFEAVVPRYADTEGDGSSSSPLFTARSRAEEDAMLDRWSAVPDGDREALCAAAAEHLRYLDDTVRPRARRVTRLMGEAQRVTVTWQQPARDAGEARRRSALDAAFALLDPVSSTTAACTCTDAVGSALVALAQRAWSSGYPYMTAAALRECWLQQWVSAVEVKAIVFGFMLAERPASVSVTAMSAWTASA